MTKRIASNVSTVAETSIFSEAEQKLAQVEKLFNTFVPHFCSFQHDVQRFVEQYENMVGNDIRNAADGFTPNTADAWHMMDLMLAESVKLGNSIREGLEHISGMEFYAKMAVRTNAAREACHD